jgi:Intracellular proteinase inhibitor
LCQKAWSAQLKIFLLTLAGRLGVTMKLARWSAAAALVIAVVGCREATSPKSSTVIGANLVRLTVTSSTSEVVRGAPVTFHVSLMNEGATPVVLHFRDSCQINPYIQDQLGKTVLPEGGWWGCAAALTNLTLNPGNDVARDFVWTGSTEFRSEMPLRPLPAGGYYFSAEVPADEVTLRATVSVRLK